MRREIENSGPDPGHGEEDSVLVVETLKGDSRAASTLFRRHVDSIYGYVLKRVGADRTVAEDIVQDVFFDAWRNLQQFHQGARFPAWLVGIAKRKLARHYRTESRKAEVVAHKVLDTLSHDGPMPEKALEAREAGLAVSRGLALAGPEVRGLLLMKYRDGLSVKEIASKMGVTAEAVNSRLQRARETFKKALTQPDP